MRKHPWPAAVAAALCLAAVGRAGEITFDESYVAGVPNPATSILGSPLTNYYAPLGVHFSGPNWGAGGVIVSDPGDYLNFGVTPHSGTNVLAFNGSVAYYNYYWWWPSLTGPIGPETISFDSPQSQVSIWAAGGLLPHTFQMQAYDANGDPVGLLDQLTTQGWEQLSVSGADISSVVLTEVGHPFDDSYVYDDLSFTAAGAQVEGSRAPEPASLALLGIGGVGGGLAGWRSWRRKIGRMTRLE